MATLESKTTFIGELYDMYRDLPDFQEFFTRFDVGVPLAWLIFNGWATPTDGGISTINDAWAALCELNGIDPSNDFDSVNEMENFLGRPLVGEA